MAREIKFRAWDIQLNTMVYASNDVIFYPQSLDKKIIMQFTGLHDKNGKEIFEGDILNKKTTFENNMADRRFQSATEIQVGFDDGYFLDINTRVVLFERMIIISSYPQKTWTDYEIIGNIYENPLK